MPKTLKILIIEKDDDVSDRIEKMVIPFTPKPDRSKTMKVLTELDYDLAILGPSFSFENQLQTVQRVKITNPRLSILMTYKRPPHGYKDITPPFPGVHYYQPELDQPGFHNTMAQALIERQYRHIWKDVPVIFGNSREANEIRKKIKEIAKNDITVLITGETGTGKELIARSLHFHSERRNGPLIKINCGSLPDELLESEVFGFQKGAFTGAHQDKPGRFELSHEGTLFIDEIGNLSFPLQAKFLQVLEEKSFSRLGGTEDQTVDTRVVAATNADLSQMVREGTFRRDLFFRLNIINIRAWPLRELKEDIPLLVQYFIDKFCLELKRDIIQVPYEIMELMETYHWPGNVRELENIVRRALVYQSWDFFKEEMDKQPMNNQEPAQEDESDTGKPTVDLENFFQSHNYSLKKISKNYVARMEKEAIQESLNLTDWNRRKAAELLGVSYKTLLNRIAELSLSK